MRESLVKKYKPYFLDDFFFTLEVKDMIHLLIDIDDLNILLFGESGKTSILNAIIREYYGLRKTDPFPIHNILFINNLKEQGIHYFRNEMKTFCQSQSSVPRKKKMIIIDDIDLINTQNQQIFCNYIDKYKHNVCFVSVCSNIHKIIENIQSRVHILKIRAPDSLDLSQMLDKIVRLEGLHLDSDAREYLLLISNYSIRALVNYLEKICIFIDSSSDIIDLTLCKSLCSNISFQRFEEYVTLLKEGNLVEAIHIIYFICDYGYSVIDILDFFFCFVKMTDMLSEDEKYRTIPLLCKYITIFHNVHEDIIELALFTNNLLEILFSGISPK
jgi:DNA polymerase III delta prime subunit